VRQDLRELKVHKVHLQVLKEIQGLKVLKGLQVLKVE
jgi:hypothetical protein